MLERHIRGDPCAPQKRASAQHDPFSNAMPQNWERLSRPTVSLIEIGARMD
jgi:hypothetical protein